MAHFNMPKVIDYELEAIKWMAELNGKNHNNLSFSLLMHLIINESIERVTVSPHTHQTRYLTNRTSFRGENIIICLLVDD